MKNKIIVSAVLFVACTFSLQVNAQILVDYNGKVGISIADTIEPLSSLSVGSAGLNNAKLSVYKNGTLSGTQYGIISHLDLEPQGGTIYSITGKCTGGAKNMIGVYGESIADNYVLPLPSGAMLYPTVYGVYGIAGGATRENFGIYGTLKDNVTAGAGVFGSINGVEGMLNERYAGYFRGKTKVNGDFYALSLNTFTNPFPLFNIGPTGPELSSRLLSLTAIQYQLQDTIVENQRIYYGFESKEMQKLFPNLVQEDKAGNISINYVELIPLLVQAVQELSAEVEELKASPKAKTLSSKKDTSNEETIEAILYQNNPNPFTTDTRIEYQLPQTTQNATLYIYNMNGSQVAEYSISTFGNGYVTVSAGALDAGMYLYSLVVNGQVIDTKRMILTK